MTDIRQSKNYAKYMESLGWVVEKIRGPDGQINVFVRHLPILSFLSVIKVQRFREVNFQRIDDIIKKHRSFLTKVEPLEEPGPEIKIAGYKKDSWPMLPTKTVVLKLDSISLDSFSKDTRYEIRRASANKLIIQESNDVNLFYKLLQETMKIGHWSAPIRKEVTSLWKAFQPNNSVILLTPVSGCLLIWHHDTAHYMYAALTKKGRELGAAYLTLWEAIKFCQRKGLKYLDLEGVYDKRRPKDNKHWQGFTKFKLGWGGKEKEYPGSWTKYF